MRNAVAPDLNADAPSEHEDYGNMLIAGDELRELKRRTDLPGLMQLLVHLSVLALTGTVVWVAQDSYGLVPAMLVHGSVLICLFAPLHETIHRTAFKSRWLNDAVARFTGLVLCLGPEFFRSFHFAHHRYTQIPGRDPELDVKAPESHLGYWVYMSGMSYWARVFTGLVNTAAGRVEAPFVSATARPLAVREARVMLGVYACAAAVVVTGTSVAPLLLWFGPMVLAQPLWRGWLLAEHTGRANNDVTVENTRTTRSNALVRHALWQMPYHVAHHAYPGIPFHALARADALITHPAHERSPGYFAFHRSWLRKLTTSKQAATGPSPN